MFSFIETKLFTRLVQEYLTDNEYRVIYYVKRGRKLNLDADHVPQERRR